MCLAIPGKVLSKQNVGGVDVGQVQFGGITRQVSLGFVPEAEVGDYVMVHYLNEGVMAHPMHLHGMVQKVIAKDGIPLSEPYDADTIMVGLLPGFSIGTVRTTRALICTSDSHTVGGGIGPRQDLTLGHEAVGVVHQVGSEVKDVQPGDRVLVGAITPAARASRK